MYVLYHGIQPDRIKELLLELYALKSNPHSDIEDTVSIRGLNYSSLCDYCYLTALVDVVSLSAVYHASFAFKSYQIQTYRAEVNEKLRVKAAEDTVSIHGLVCTCQCFSTRPRQSSLTSPQRLICITSGVTCVDFCCRPRGRSWDVIVARRK